MTKKIIEQSALITKWNIPFNRATSQCSLYWVISPDGGLSDLFIMVVKMEILLTDRGTIEPTKIIKDTFKKNVNDLWRDWKKGVITRSVLKEFETEERTLIVTPLTTFITTIPGAYKDYLHPYKK